MDAHQQFRARVEHEGGAALHILPLLPNRRVFIAQRIVAFARHHNLRAARLQRLLQKLCHAQVILFLPPAARRARAAVVSAMSRIHGDQAAFQRLRHGGGNRRFFVLRRRDHQRESKNHDHCAYAVQNMGICMPSHKPAAPFHLVSDYELSGKDMPFPQEQTKVCGQACERTLVGFSTYQQGYPQFFFSRPPTFSTLSTTYPHHLSPGVEDFSAPWTRC